MYMNKIVLISGTHFMADVVNSILYESGQLTKEQDRFFCVTALEMRMPSLRQKGKQAEHLLFVPYVLYSLLVFLFIHQTVPCFYHLRFEGNTG